MKKVRPILLLSLLFACFGNMQQSMAQRLELRFNKEFSNDEIVNKGIGGGASFIIEGWHPNLDFQINFDYAGHNEETNYLGISYKFAKFKGGVSALYTHPLGKSFHLRLGGDVSYNMLRKIATNHADTSAVLGYSMATHRAQMIGIGAVAQIQAQLGRIFRISVGVTPTYLIAVSTKTNRPEVACDFKKGIFVCQLQLGLVISLNNNNDKEQ